MAEKSSPFFKGGECYMYATGKRKKEREIEEVGRKMDLDNDGASLALRLEELFHMGSDRSCWQVCGCGCGCIWKKQEEFEDFFFPKVILITNTFLIFTQF